MDWKDDTMSYAIEVSGLKKKFSEKGKPIWALKGIDLRIKKGEVFGFLGPNGAGKTTAIYIMSTLLSPTSGKVRILGLDVTENPSEVRGKIGLCIGGTRMYWGQLRCGAISTICRRAFRMAGLSPRRSALMDAR